MMVTDTVLIVFLAAQAVFLPLLGGLWYGMRVENERKERILASCLKALGLIVITRGRSKHLG